MMRMLSSPLLFPHSSSNWCDAQNNSLHSCFIPLARSPSLSHSLSPLNPLPPSPSSWTHGLAFCLTRSLLLNHLAILKESSFDEEDDDHFEYCRRLPSSQHHHHHHTCHAPSIQGLPLVPPVNMLECVWVHERETHCDECTAPPNDV